LVQQELAALAGVSLSSDDAQLRPGAGSLAGSDGAVVPTCWYQPGLTPDQLVDIVNSVWRAWTHDGGDPAQLAAANAWRDRYLSDLHFGENGWWFYAHCTDWSGPAAAAFFATNPDAFIWVPTGGPAPPVAGTVLTPEQLARYARDAIVLPDTAVELNPPRARAVTNLTTWVWLDRASFRPYTVRAQAGPVWVDAVATPVRLLLPRNLPARLTPADGICARLFDAYTGGPDARPGCGITFTRSSATQPGRAYRVRVRVVWQVSWTSNWAPGGRLPDGVYGQTTPVTVREVQAVIAG
jgi:enoyl reductase